MMMKDDSLREVVNFEDQVGPGSPLTNDEWSRNYTMLKHYADMMSGIMKDLARKISGDAGLDPTLLGVHPHNAMCAYAGGQPWPNVDYNRVMVVMDLLNHQFDAQRTVDAFDKAVRLNPHSRWLEKHQPVKLLDANVEEMVK
jgi:hypothetical protein